MRRAKRLIGLALGLAAFFVAATAGVVWAESLSYLDDQKIDEGLGILDRPWDLNLVNVNSRLDQLLQVKPGFPPYDQQVERAQQLPERICFDNQMQQIPC